VSLRFDPDLRAQPGPGIDDPTSDLLNNEPASSNLLSNEPQTGLLADEGTDLEINHELALIELPDDVTPALRVTAILVAHDGAEFLPRTLDAIEAQSRPPDLLVAVDAGSLDGGGDLLTPVAGQLLLVNRDTTFGDAVQAALGTLDRQALAARPEPGPDSSGAGATRAAGTTATGPENRWLWLLHDDSAPAPDALERLIEAVDGGPSIGIAGCKQVSWDDGTRLLDVGFTTSRLGARVTGIDVDDVDQGQLDHRSDVLAVGTAGMLIRRDVWDRLGGPDPALSRARDDLDLCRRAHLAGLRVVVVPRAVIAHAEATASGRRSSGSDIAWALHDRRAAVHLRLVSVPLLLLPFLMIWLAVAAVTRALGRLALKQPRHAAAELLALGLTLIRPLAWFRARRRIWGNRELPRRDFRRLLAGPRQTLRQRHDAVSSYLHLPELLPAGAAPADVGGTSSGPNPDQGDQGSVEVPFDSDPTATARRPGLRIGVGVAALAGIAGLAGLRLLLSGTGVALGPALIPSPSTAGELWSMATSSWRPSGLGSAAVADPFDAVLAVIAWPLRGSTQAATGLLLLGALPLSALLGWWAAGGVTRSRALRAWAALTWAAAPSLLTAVAAGRLPAIVAHLALPGAALALARTINARPAPGPAEPVPPGSGRGSLAAASAAGLLLSVLIAAAPSLLLPVLVALLMAAVLGRQGRVLLIWVVAVPAVLLLPWWLAVVNNPWLVLAGPAEAGTTGPVVAGWPAALWPADPATLDQGPVRRLAQMAVDLTSHGDATIWLRGVSVLLVLPLLLLGLSGLLRRGSSRVAGACWLVGLSGLAVAVLTPVLTARFDGSAGRLSWPTAAVSLLTFAVLTAALARLDGAARRLRSRSLSFKHWAAVVAAMVAVLAPMLILGTWTADGWSANRGDWVHRGSPDVLPAVSTAEAEGPAQTRTLVLKLTKTAVRWSLYRSGGPRLGQDSAAALAMSGKADAPVLAVIGGLLGQPDVDQRQALAELDIGSILLLPPAQPAATAALDTAAELTRVSTPNRDLLWRVGLDGRGGGPVGPARVQVLSATGQIIAALPSHGTGVHATLAAGPAGRRLVLAERADAGWRAWLNGHRLTPTRQAGWAQGFALPAGGGTVVVRHVWPAGREIDSGRLAVLGLAVLVALPLPRRNNRMRPEPPMFAADPDQPGPPVGPDGPRPFLGPDELPDPSTARPGDTMFLPPADVDQGDGISR